MSPAVPHARALLPLACALGLAGDLLLRATPPGLGVGLWTLACVAAAVHLRRRTGSGDLSFLAPLLATAAFGLAFAWRDSAILQALFGCAALVSGAAAFVDRPARAGITSHAAAAIASLTSAVFGPVLVLAGARSGAPGGARPRWRVALVGSLAAAPLLLVFGTLFASADPLFAKYAGDLARSLDDALDHGVTTIAIAWLAGGLLAGLALARCPADLDLGRPPGWIADAVAIVLALVAALFVAFLAVQARVLVGGRELVEATVGLGYAEYARSGFFQLLACAGLALPLVLFADWAAVPGDRRRARIVGLSGALVAMVLVVLASAARRMSLYVDAYGLSELRLYASAGMVWLGIAFVAFAVGSARGSRRRFALHAHAAAAVLVVGLGVVSPQATIVRVNAARASASVAGFDEVYATSLGADAVPALLDVLPSLPPRPRCAVARDLIARSASPVPADWRSLNLSRHRAGVRLAAARDELETALLACPAPKVPGPDALTTPPRRG